MVRRLADTGKVNWIRGPHGSPYNSTGVERSQDTGSRKNRKELEWRCGRGQGKGGTVRAWGVLWNLGLEFIFLTVCSL